MELIKKSYSTLVGKSEWKKPLGRPKCRWEDVDWIHLTEDRNQWLATVNTVMKLRVP
jgi:hypothetical protein